MRALAAVVLLLTLQAHAGELLPMSGEKSSHMQKAIYKVLRPTVMAIPPGIAVEPILESIHIRGRGARFLWGPLAGSSHIVLRLRITDGDKITDEVISTKNGAWKGTFRPGQDYDMVDRVVTQAAELVATYASAQHAQSQAVESPNTVPPEGVLTVAPAPP